VSDTEERYQEITTFIEGVYRATQFTPEEMAAVGDAVSDKIVERTEGEGVDCRGAVFKSYSTRPTYIGGKYLPFAQAAGGRRTAIKAGARITGKHGRAHGPTQPMKSVYFPGGYAQFKSGLGSNHVDLKVSGELLGLRGHRRPFGVVTAGLNECVIDWTDSDERKKAEDLYLRKYEMWGWGERDGEMDWLVGLFQGMIQAKLEATDGNA
jgi:hypothetical protein